MSYQTFVIDPNNTGKFLTVEDEQVAKLLNRLPAAVFIADIAKRRQEPERLLLEVQLLKELSVLGVIGLISDASNDLVVSLVATWTKVNAFWLLDLVDDVLTEKLNA